jgi:DNA-nicking Smr family endonuclease
VLKGGVVDWLVEAPLASLVLAFATAQPRDGGAGASYVLLRRARRD